MRFLNTKNPDDAIKLYPWLIPTDTETRLDITRELIWRLEEKPGDTYVLVAIEHDVTQGVVIAYVSETRKKTVWLWQAQVVPGFTQSRLMFDALRAWTKSKGAKYIRMKTDRDKRRVFERAYGFKRKGSEMRKYVW